jgi:hypothetical protein
LVLSSSSDPDNSLQSERVCVLDVTPGKAKNNDLITIVSLLGDNNLRVRNAIAFSIRDSEILLKGLLNALATHGDSKASIILENHYNVR